MAKRKRQKTTASQKPIASKPIIQSQLSNLYSPAIRSRAHGLSPLNLQLMQDSFLSNGNIIWERTSNCKVGKVHNKGFTVRLLRRSRPGDRKGERKHSKMYDTAIKAENDAFDFRYNLESKACQELIDAYKDNYRLSTNVILQSDKERNVLITPARNNKRHPSTLKGMRMSGSPRLNRSNISTNPNNCYPTNPCSIDPDLIKTCALKIQRLVKNADVRRSAKKMKETLKNQAYHASLINHLSKYIANNNCELLLLGSEDPEILASYSNYDKFHVTTKTRHIVAALAALHLATSNDTPTNWIQCCEIAIAKKL